MIDLSFLTEEEQEAIMKVLQRDAELKRAEEERVRHLPEKVKDDVQLKNMSGQWFYEAKSKRHRDKIHGADIIRASMRRKPATLAELSQNKSNKAKNSWVSNVNKEVFVPPELHGIVEHQEEQQPQLCSSSKTITSTLDAPEERPTKAAVSPVKPRRNPFNFTASDDNLNSGESEHRPAILPQLSNKEILSPSKESQPKPHLGNDEAEKPKEPSVDPPDETQKGLVKRPVPKARKLIHKATAPVSQREDVPKPAKRTERINGIGTPPRGILKRSSSSSSTDSEVRVSQMLDVQKKNGLPTTTIFEGEAEKNSLVEEAEDSTQVSLEKLKQVRFSSGTGKGEPLQSPQLHHSREKGEFDLLESDETKSSGNDALRSDMFGNKQTSAVKPSGICSSALQVKTIDGLQNGSSASSPCDTNRSVFSVNETLQAKTVNPKKPETPQKTSNDILPNSSNKPRVETCESETNQSLSHESKPHKSINDEHQLSAKTEVCDVTKTNYESFQQGKPHLVEEKHTKTAFQPDKHADELMKVADESVSRVLDWFKRSSGTEDRKPVSARSQGREPKEDVGFSTRTAGLPTQCSMDRKTEVKEELPFGKLKQRNSISSTSFISEDKQLIKERMEPKKGEENEGQSEKSLTGSVCTRVEEKQPGQEITQPNQKSDLLVHQEHKVPAQKRESEKAIRERRRIREIRAFWEGNKSFPSYGEKEVDTNASGGSGERDKIKPTAVYLPNGLDDQSKNTLRGAELSCASQASRNKHQNSFEFGQGHAVQKPESTLLSDGKVHENTGLPKASNLQPRVGPALASPESEGTDEKETLKGKLAATSQQKHSFQVLSSKEKMNENSKDQILDPSHFQSLRNFWDNGVKLQSSIDRAGVSLPNNTSSITNERKAKEDDKGRDKQEFIQQQTQTLKRETNQKLDSVCGLPPQSPALEGLNVTHTKNRESVQLGRKAILSKPQESVGLPEREVKECVDKSVVSSKEHHVSFQLRQSPGDKDNFKEEAEDDCLCLSMEKVENKVTPLEISLPKEEVAETVDKVVLPKAEFNLFKLGLKNLENEASEMSSSLNLKGNILKGTTFHSDQCKVSERSIGQSHDTSPANGKEEMSKTTGDKHENKNSLRKLFREFEPFHLQLQPAEKDDNLWGSQRPQAGSSDLLRETFACQPSEYRRVGIKTSDDTNMSQTNCSVESTCQEDNGQPEEVNETTEVSIVPPKVSGLSSALEKLMEEASETPPPKPRCADSTAQRAAEMQVKNMTYEHDGELPQEIRETVEKSVVPSKVSGLNSALEKLMKEASETPPPKPKRAISTEQRPAEVEVKGTTYEHDGEVLQEIRETVEKSIAPPKANGLSSALEKLMKEAPETLPPKPKHAISTEQRAAEGTTYEHDGELLQEIVETVERSVLSKADYGLLDVNLQKLLKEVSETPASELRNMDKQTQGKMQTSQSLHVPHQQERDHPQEIQERIEKTQISNIKKFSEFSSSLEKLRQEVSQTSSPLSKELHKGDDSNFPWPEGAQLCLTSQCEDNEEEEGDDSCCGYKFSDENSDFYSGTGSSIRSEEELNPVLMALKRSADRKMPSKSLEDIPSATSNKRKINNPKEELALSAEDGPKPNQERNENAARISTVPSQPDKLFSNPDKMKGLSKSVPSFLQEESDERETDTASESSYSLGRIKKSPSSLTNLSGSSGMASLSSVSGSLMSIYSTDFGNVDVKGNIQFAVDYVEQLNELHIFICQCKDLAVADVKRQRSDPYVKTYLLPEKYKLGKRKTSVKKKTFNPVYNEILRYKIEKDLLKNQSLNISVWHNDTFGRNSFLGEVELDLGMWDWNDKSNKQINWFPLKPRTSTISFQPENRGEMKLALQYVPHPVGGKKTLSTGEVHIWVKECHDLPLLRGNRLNSFIKCTVLPDTSRKSRQKTRTVAKTTNPVFNHTMVYDGFRPEDLKEACVELTVWDHNKLANHFLGGLRIGLGTGKSYGTVVDWMDSTSAETALWEKMMNSPNMWVEDTLPLRMLMVAKLTK